MVRSWRTDEIDSPCLWRYQARRAWARLRRQARLCVGVVIHKGELVNALVQNQKKEEEEKWDCRTHTQTPRKRQ